MTLYEYFILLISVLAIVISAVSLIRTRRIASQQLELERITAELSAKQLQFLEAEETALSKAKIDVELEGYGSDYNLIVTNVGGAVARDVSFSIEGESPVLDGEYKEKFPIRELRSGKSVSLCAALSMGSPSQYNVLVHWKNPDDSEEQDEILITW